MASTWSDLKFELIGTGDQSGTWGATTNDNLGIAIQQAIGGKADVTMSSTTITLTLTDTTALQNARALYLNLTGTPGGAATLNVPAVQKSYIVYNNTTGGFAVTVKVSGQTGVSVPNGKSMLLYDNGTDVVDAITHLSSLTLGSALPIASGGTGSTSTTFVNLASNVTGTLPVANGGTGLSTTTAYGLIAAGTTSTGNFQQVSGTGTSGQVLTSNGAGALPTWQAGASGNVTTSGNNAFTGANTFYNATGQTFAPATTNDGIILQGRAGGSSSYRVTFATATLSANRTLTFPDATDTAAVLGTAQTFTAAQTFQAANAIRSEAASTQDAVVVAGRAGGTSSYAATITPTTLTGNRTLTIPDASGTILQSGTAVTVAQGGTGATTLTANNVILGNGTSAVQFVAPGTNGNVLTSNGTTWQSTAPAGGGSWIRLSNATAFSSSTLDFTGFVTSDYNTYAVVIYAYSIQSGSYGAFRFFVGGTIQTSGYSGSGFYSDSTPQLLARGGSSGSSAQLIQLTNAANVNQAGIIFINANNYNSLTGTGIPSMFSQIGGGASTNTHFYQSGSLNTTSPITGIRFFVDGSGTFAGYFNLYGIKRN